MKKQQLTIIVIVIIILCGISILYFYYNPIEECIYLDDGAKVCGDVDCMLILNHSAYTTRETDYTYKVLGEGFVHSNEATNYYVKVEIFKNTSDSIDEKKLTIKFLDKDGNFLDSAWVEGDDIRIKWKTNSGNYTFSISRDSLGNNFDKVEKISFRISDYVQSENNKCGYFTETKYHDERFFGTWTNNSNEINDSCADLFRYYTFYSNGTGMCPHGKFNWDSVVSHGYDYSYVDLTGYNYSALFDSSYNPYIYDAHLVFEFKNNNQIVTLDNGLFSGSYNYCHGFDFSLDYTKQ